MVKIVLVLGVVNLCLGFALALAADLPLAWPRFSSRRRWRLRLARRVRRRDRVEGPRELEALLRERGIQPASVLEAVLWTFRFELADHFQTLRDGGFMASGDLDAPAVDAVVSLWTAWRKRTRQRASVLSTDSNPVDPAANQLVEQALLDHAYQIKVALEKIHEADAHGEELEYGLHSLYAAGHQLRDFVDDFLAGWLREQDRLDLIEEPLQLRPGSSSIFSRLGLETLLRDWWVRDGERVRVVSCVLVNVDRFAEVNARWGEEPGDRIADAVEQLVQEKLRQGRGFDRGVRFSGQEYLLFLGDTAYRNASSGADRIRQSIESATFRIGKENAKLTVRCGVIEIGKEEQVDDWLARLRACVTRAKQSGGNQTFLDDGSGPQPTEWPQFEVTSQVVDIPLAPPQGVDSSGESPDGDPIDSDPHDGATGPTTDSTSTAAESPGAERADALLGARAGA